MVRYLLTFPNILHVHHIMMFCGEKKPHVNVFFFRFEDAPGEGMKICPVCSTSFSADVSESNFEAHILAHVGRICPLCHNMIDNCTDEDFEHHVNKHLDQRNMNPEQDTTMEFD